MQPRVQYERLPKHCDVHAVWFARCVHVSLLRIEHQIRRNIQLGPVLNRLLPSFYQGRMKASHTRVDEVIPYHKSGVRRSEALHGHGA
jgi:hypothetical protein